ncbi:alkylation response protein AidB-like acyl-CoA dehydrogenase [Nocardioides ginsengisegetis]|uniref:Alkylation response protein AidB-like acyl-CoA dehydrogenase n=1 Tax=Nocardioides ginsengisegetis TaxID=661491 RepID=A0A7W3IZX5_9ACTN|nr:acyl-CoA dehydrogenase family protein [Nocardioides ginsengisegetis]MBA8803589.1 alkylation response protein AidB-like acyl-CoA dehydrogenase [Nocardioides ginsengisegetis]
MDFTFTPEQDEAATLAARILTDRATNERMKAVEQAGDRFDRELWAELGNAGLLSLALPEEYDGSGLGLVALFRVLVEVGRRVAPVPLAAHGPASLLVAECGSPAQQAAWLPGAATGATVLTAAVAEERAFAPERPSTVASRDGEGWLLTGSKAIVPAGTSADLFLVPADTGDGVAVFLVTPADPGVIVVPQRTSDGDTVARLDLSGVAMAEDRRLPGDGAAHRLRQLLLVAASAEQLGITEGALQLTAAYAKTREQFGRPIGTFQAVSQRLADGYIDVLAQRLTLWQAAWRLEEGLPADSEVAIAKMWAADAGHRLAHTTVHVHGGVGIDLDGEAHRYFTSAKRFEFLHGGSTEQALTVGRALAAEPA